MHFSCRGNAFLGLVAPWRRVISLCTQCQAKDLCFFDPTCSGCQDLLLEWVISSPPSSCALLFFTSPSLPPSFLLPPSLITSSFCKFSFLCLESHIPVSSFSHYTPIPISTLSHSHIHIRQFTCLRVHIPISTLSHSHIHIISFPYCASIHSLQFQHHHLSAVCSHATMGSADPEKHVFSLQRGTYIHTYIHRQYTIETTVEYIWY